MKQKSLQNLNSATFGAFLAIALVGMNYCDESFCAALITIIASCICLICVSVRIMEEFL